MKRKTPAAKKTALPLCARHQTAYTLVGARPVCRHCESEANGGQRVPAEAAQ